MFNPIVMSERTLFFFKNVTCTCFIKIEEEGDYNLCDPRLGAHTRATCQIMTTYRPTSHRTSYEARQGY
jgi:hypothetical protein